MQLSESLFLLARPEAKLSGTGLNDRRGQICADQTRQQELDPLRQHGLRAKLGYQYASQ